MDRSVDKKTSAKRELILTRAKQVFIRKGFAAVTMKDIIEECGISRGGLYLYFQSVDEIFMHVIETHNQRKWNEAKQHLSEDKCFEQLIDEYLAKQKKRLMNLNNSLLVPMYEYRFANRDEYHKSFFNKQFTDTKNVVSEILDCGFAKCGKGSRCTETLATGIVLLIEGISMLAVGAGITEGFIDSQMALIKDMIFLKKACP
jgi:AcrR family transcriptional regulator